MYMFVAADLQNKMTSMGCAPATAFSPNNSTPRRKVSQLDSLGWQSIVFTGFMCNNLRLGPDMG